MMETTPERSRRWGLGLGCALAAGALGWWLLRPAAVAPDVPGPAARAQESAPAPQAEASTAPVSFYDNLPIRPAGSVAANAQGMIPHPITPQHQRIFHENNLIGDLNGAMDAKDAAGLRALLRQYRDEYPEDAHVLQDGYELVANCLEHPDAETRAIAQRYYDEQRDSGLRRYIRRYCLE